MLVIDIGSSSIKTNLYSMQAHLLSEFSSQIYHSIDTDKNGKFIQNPSVLVKKIIQSIDLTLGKSKGKIGKIMAVGVDCMSSTLLGIDKNRNPVTPVYLYSDTRSFREVEEIQKNFDPDKLFDDTGVTQHTSYIPSKILWIKKKLKYNVDKFIDFSTFFYSEIFEDFHFDSSFSVASWSGLLDRKKLAWHKELCSYLQINENNLPNLYSYDKKCLGLKKEYKNRWTKLRDIPFFLAVGDGLGANIGSGAIKNNRIGLTIGSTGAIRLLLPKSNKKILPGLWEYQFTDKYSLLGGSFSEGGNIISWAKNNLKLSNVSNIDSILSNKKPAEHGMSILPFFGGERSIGWNDNAKAVISGLTFSSQPEDILQAMLESLAIRFSLVLDMIKKYSTKEFSIILSGGVFRRSNWFKQTLSDILTHPLEISEEPEETSRGTAILAIKGITNNFEFSSFKIKNTSIINPSKKNIDIYSEEKIKHVELYKKINNIDYDL